MACDEVRIVAIIEDICVASYGRSQPCMMAPICHKTYQEEDKKMQVARHCGGGQKAGEVHSWQK